MLLAGDVGGTKTLLGLFTRAPLRPVPAAVRSFPTLEYDGLVPMIREFLNSQPGGAPPIDGACFGVAGPVMPTVCPSALALLCRYRSTKSVAAFFRTSLVKVVDATT